MTNSRHVVIRVDGSAEIGLGHVMRSLALAAVLVRNGTKVELWSKPLPTQVADRARRIGVSSRTVSAPAGATEDALELAKTHADLVLVDGYHFGSEFFATLGEHDCPYAVIDDSGDTAALAPLLVINQNPSASAGMYGRFDRSVQLLLGLDFVMLRDEIRQARRSARTAQRSEAVLVSIGGSDPCGLTAPIVNELVGSGFPVRVAIGAANANRQSLVDALASAGADVIRPEKFDGVLASAAVAVIGAGSTMWEAAHLGVPAVGVVVAGNQVWPCEAARDLGLVRLVDGRTSAAATGAAEAAERLLGDPSALTHMSAVGPRLVDGVGAERVAAEIGTVLEGRN